MKKEPLKKYKTPWPTKAAMEQIYELNLWGTNGSEFYSGSGSHDEKIIVPYIKAVNSFFKSFKEPLTVCDLGCGDFNVGKQLLTYVKEYIAVDIVFDLIERNKEKFKRENVHFVCSDISKDTLPKTDCVLIRQVLQHLSNDEVSRIVPKLKEYTYLILTEHLPENDFIPNLDIISGQGIRLKKNSGINLLAAPFYLKVKETQELVSITLPNGKGKIVTYVYTL